MKVDRLPNGWALISHMDPIEVTSIGPEPDPDWTYTDSGGHEHSAGGGRYPTLQLVDDETYWCADCRDEHTNSHYECPLCGEHIVPGTRFPAGRRFINGPVTIALSGPGGQNLILTPQDVEAMETRGVGVVADEIINERGMREHGRA